LGVLGSTGWWNFCLLVTVLCMVNGGCLQVG
jgi:hypothetical protein